MARKKAKTIKSEIKAVETAAEKAKSAREREFLSSFMKQLLIAKEKQIIEEKKIGKKEKAEKEVAVVEKKLRLGIMKGRKMREKLKPLTLEEEKVEPEKMEEIVEAAPKPTPPPTEVAPVYKRPLPILPKAPKPEKEYPLPEPRSPARPPEEEAMAPPTVQFPTPEAPEVPEAPALAPPAPVPPPPPEEKYEAITGIDLGKLNSLVKDDGVSLIQCDGANLSIKITREGTIQETKITLNEDEIKAAVQKFADRAGQPLSEPIFKTQVGNLLITAVISAFAGSRFVISRV
ncbi:MAG: hypothetical protein IB618_01640 [Candidatus Pacearchaeota archaeon]|nr:MAG: hypothetical protein IB618_01640 [Candidatus Pacearchaeota archaeon]